MGISRDGILNLVVANSPVQLASTCIKTRNCAESVETAMADLDRNVFRFRRLVPLWSRQSSAHGTSAATEGRDSSFPQGQAGHRVCPIPPSPHIE